MKIKRKEKQMLEAEKAKRFAYWYFILRDAGRAARKVGEPEENGILFLSERKRTLKEICWRDFLYKNTARGKEENTNSGTR